MTRDSDWELLRRCERILAEGDVPAALIEAVANARSKLGRRLAPREAELMGLLAAGHTHGEIAARMHISKSTVGRHITHVREKLGARNQAHAVALFLALPGRDEAPANLAGASNTGQ